MTAIENDFYLIQEMRSKDKSTNKIIVLQSSKNHILWPTTTLIEL